MKRFIGLFVATVAVALPLSAAGASPATTKPANYRPECEQFYQGGKVVLDPVLTNAKSIAGPLEKGYCGEQKHTP